MNDLPIFLQIFARLFAFLALGAWLQVFVPDASEGQSDSEHSGKSCQVVRKGQEQVAPKMTDAPAAVSKK